MRTAYVAGKMPGLLTDCTKEKFDDVANKLIQKGYHVINPLKMADHNEQKSWDESVRSEIKKMLECDVGAPAPRLAGKPRGNAGTGYCAQVRYGSGLPLTP